MAFSADLIHRLAREWLGRALPEELAAETARRLGALVTRVRGLEEGELRESGPATAFDPGHPCWQTGAGVPARPWSGLGVADPGSSGYSGSVAAADPAEAVPERPAPVAAAGAVDPLLFAPLAEVADRIRRREVSPTEVTRAVLDRITAVQPALNAYYTVTAEAALGVARAQEQALTRGEAAGALFGIPIALKDLFETAGVRTTAGSRVLAEYVPNADATTVRLLVSAGAIVVGKTATHEFAFGCTTDNPHFGPTRNPWHPACVPGGSSGGSGAAVAAGAAFMAMGSDTGGSIRIPAAACGVVGLKPTYGRVSKHGVIPLSWSLDHVGPLTRTVLDAAIVLAAIAGPDPQDPTALPAAPQGWVAAAKEGAAASLAGCRVGVDSRWAEERVHPAVQAAFAGALAQLQSLGAEVVEVELPSADGMMLVNRLLALSEAGSFHGAHLAQAADLFGSDVRARLELGQFILARDYLLAQRLRGEFTRHCNRLLAGVEAVVTPCLPLPAPYIGSTAYPWPEGAEAIPDALIRLTAPFNVTGHPAITVPCGLTAAGLPLGLQVVGRPFDEASILRIAAAYEAATPWHRWRPPI